jgi:hypothetical protein
MNCPRCHTELHESDRDGITIDVCRNCRGLWLDRGELEKMIARSTRDLDDDVEPRSSRSRHSNEHGEWRDSTPTGLHRDEHGRYRRRKKSWVESLGDIFD